MKMKIIFMSIFWAFMSVCTYNAVAQNPIASPKKGQVTIGNTVVTREGTDIVVVYKILFGKNVLSCNVDVVLNVEGRNGYSIPLDNDELTGDFGKIKEPGLKKFRYNIEKDKYQLAGRNLSFTLEVNNKNVLEDEVLVMASVGAWPQLSYGLMLGYVKKFGGYIKCRSDFNFGEASYSCDSAGNIVDGGFIWTTGTQREKRLQATAGLLFRATKWLYPYAGAGYGYREVHWQDYEDNWVNVKDYSCAGVSAEVGLILKTGPVALSAGFSTTSFRFSEVEVGIGLMF